MKATYILAILVVLLLAGCAKKDAMVDNQPTAPEAPEVPVAPSEPEAPVAPEVPAEEAPAGPDEVILLADSAAEPADVTIAAGGSVTFKNNAEKRPHMIIVDELSERSTRMEIGDTYTFVFPEAGEYTYRDMWVGSLRGTITVE